uniref:Uncharacterized protein n=1 Tax=Cacopsylla melanoneura TaxID=428564 RepID=A0A8D8SL75_9HEMI
MTENGLVRQFSKQSTCKHLPYQRFRVDSLFRRHSSQLCSDVCSNQSEFVFLLFHNIDSFVENIQSLKRLAVVRRINHATFLLAVGQKDLEWQRGNGILSYKLTFV